MFDDEFRRDFFGLGKKPLPAQTLRQKYIAALAPAMIADYQRSGCTMPLRENKKAMENMAKDCAAMADALIATETAK